MSPQAITTKHGRCGPWNIRRSRNILCRSTLTLPTHCCHYNKFHPFQPHSPAPLVTCMYSHHTTHNPLQTINVLHRTPEGTLIGLVHTHLVTSSGVQLVLINNEPHDISMTVLSCPVDHTVPSVASAVELGLHFQSQIADDIDMATHCSMVQGIGPILQKGSITSEDKNLFVRCEIKW